MPKKVTNPPDRRDEARGVTPPELIWTGLIDQGFATVRTAIRWGGVVASLYLVYLALGELAGKDTRLAISILLNWLVSMRAAAPMGVGIAGLAYGYTERRLRRRTILRMHTRIKEMELLLDRNRSSSDLTPTGDTNPRDMEE